MTAHDNPVLPSDRGPGAGRSAGDVLDVKDESQEPRTFVRKRRQSRDGAGAIAEPTDPARPETPAQSTVPSKDGRHIDGDSRERIVVPRQERDGRRSSLNIELREVRYGPISKGVYLRVVPRHKQFKQRGAGYFEATLEGSRPGARSLGWNPPSNRRSLAVRSPLHASYMSA